MYEELKKFLKQTGVKDKFEMEFIDLKEDDLSAYRDTLKIIDMGHQLPITIISGKPTFSGKVDSYQAY